MSSIRSLVSECYAYVIVVILSISKIMPSCSCCTEKKLVCTVITAFSSRQSSFYIKCIKLNIRLFCNVKLVSNAEYL